MVKAVIFDLDGVIVDTEIYDDENTKKFLEQYHIYKPDKVRRQMAGLQFYRYSEFMIQWFKEAGYQEMTQEELTRLFLDYSGKQKEENPVSFREIQDPDIRNVMKVLKDRGYQVAIASSSPHEKIDRVTEELELTDYVDLTVSGKDFKESKPNPEIYLYTIKALRLPAGECVAVEDSTYGIQAAKGAGLITIAKRDDRFAYNQMLADFRVDRLSQLLEVFGELRKM